MIGPKQISDNPQGQTKDKPRIREEAPKPTNPLDQLLDKPHLRNLK